MLSNNFNSKLKKSIRKVCKNNNKIYLHEPIFTNDEKKLLNNCIKSTFVSTSGKFVKDFENKLSKFCKSKFILATNSGTSALHIAYIVANLGKKDEILVPALNYVASANVAKYVGSTPHFIEVESDSFGIDVKKLDKYLKKNTKKKGNYFYNKETDRKISAIVPTHLYGKIGNMNGIIKIAKKYNLILIEDAAEAIGSYVNSKHAGTFGRMGILSFNGNKTITTGSGGAILFKYKSDYLKAKLIANVGKINSNFKIIFKVLGYNYKMNNIQAALGIAQLKKLKKILRFKKNLHEKYKKEFKNFSEFRLFENNFSKSYNYWINLIIFNDISKDKKNKIIKYLSNNNIETRPSWDLINSIEYFKNCPKMKLTISEKLYQKIINLPSSPKYGQ